MVRLDVVSSPFCWLKTLGRTLNLGALVSGHDFVETEIHKSCEVSVLKCECCGKTSVCWRPL
jgi:hypothetical protein